MQVEGTREKVKRNLFRWRSTPLTNGGFLRIERSAGSVAVEDIGINGWTFGLLISCSRQTNGQGSEKQLVVRTDFYQEPDHLNWRKVSCHRLGLFSAERENEGGRNHLPFSPHWHEHVHCDDLHPSEAREKRETSRSAMFEDVRLPSCRVASTLWSLTDGAFLGRDSLLDCCTSVEYLSYCSHVVGRRHPIRRTPV